ncbi:MAG: DUF2262 domain-containing protein [Coprococcus sp.]
MSKKEVENFEQQFEKEEMELTVLMKSGCNGACVSGEWLIPSVNFVASIDQANNLSKKEGRLEWIIPKQTDREGFGYDFVQYGIYHILVRKCIPKELNQYQSEVMNNRYRLIKILAKDVQNDRLLELKEYLQRPVTIETEFGNFVLEREYDIFSSVIDWCGNEVNVTLEQDDDREETANSALDSFLAIAKNMREFDKRNREYAADKMLSSANDWLAEDDSPDKPDEITREMFIERMELSEMCVNSDGSITWYYLDGDMFWGHAIVIDMEEDGTYSDAYIAG